MLKKLILAGTVACAITSIWNLAEKIRYTKVGETINSKIQNVKTKIKHNPKVKTIES